METPGDNSITVVDPQVQPFADSNLNEKNLSTQYIYTAEGQLIPTTEVPIPADLNSQHYNTVHVTEAQSIQVDYQYQGQYQDSNVQQIVPVTAAEFVQDNAGYVLEQSEFIPDSTSAVVQTAEQVYPEQAQPTVASSDYVYEATPAQTYVTQESLVTTQGDDFVPEYTSADVSQTVPEPENTEKDAQPVVEGVEQAAEPTEDVPPPQAESTNDDKEISKASENVEPDTNQDKPAEVESNSEPPSVSQDNKNEEKVEESVEKVDDAPTVDVDATVEDVPVALSEEVAEQVDSVAVEEQTTVVEATAAEKTEETLVIMYDETSSQEEVKNEESTQAAPTSDPPPTRKPRGRRPKTEVPLHILGHDVNKPVENVLNGKTPKPRLGVKVPYRTLTSQIVSREDLEKEIVARGKKRHEEMKEISEFSRSLTNRLAKQIVPQSKKSRQSTSKEIKESASQSSEMDVDSVEDKNEPKEKPKDAIDNNSDLLAILEGDGDAEDIPIVSKPQEESTESTPSDETNLKNLEREIALQQLQDLPYLSPSTRFVKSRSCKPFLKEIPKTVLDTQASGKGTTVTAKAGTTKPSLSKEKSPLKSGVLKASPEKKIIADVEVEPQIKVNMALKTYSRKRKSSENSVASSASPVKKVTTASSASPTRDIDLKPQPTSDVYITKSSRIIKKKVIWDPDDEIPSPRLSLSKPPVKADQQFSKPSPKAAHTKNDNRSAEQAKKPSADGRVVKNEKKAAEEKSHLSKRSPAVADKKPSPSSKTLLKPKKSRSEVDKLLGDEGAIKMLYELKTSEDAIEEKRKKTVISVEKTFKELAKRANQIKSDLIASTVETPKSLRKKELSVSPGVPHAKVTPTAVPASPVPSGISRQKSKDSSRSTPPPSPSFSYPNETSYLIRRRSSSSISSGDDTGGSMDFDETEERLSKKRPVNPQTDPLKIKKSKKSNSESEKSQKRAENRIGHYNTFTFKKVNKSVTIDLHTIEGTKCYFTAEVLEELTTALNKIAKEKDCNSVLLRSSQANVFSLGLDYKSLVSDKESVRKNKATELADRVSDFITCLLNFPKVLVAGIQGECVGLAVTILPLFDVVIASDKAHFSTPYSTLGCIAEAGFLLTMPHVTSHGLAADLFYTSQKLTADEAFRRGLISKVCWPEKYQDTVKSTMASISKGSKQSLEATKKQLRANVMDGTKAAIMSMAEQLIDHWTSSECQTNFASIE